MKDKIIQEVYTQRYRAGTYRLNEMSRQYVRHKHTHTLLGCLHISLQITSENNSLHFISPWYQLRLLYISEKHLDFFSPCLPALFSLSGLFFIILEMITWLFKVLDSIIAMMDKQLCMMLKKTSLTVVHGKPVPSCTVLLCIFFLFLLFCNSKTNTIQIILYF